MKSIDSVDLIDSPVESSLIKELPHEVSHVNNCQPMSKIKGDSMMKETKDSKTALPFPSNDYPNRQIRKAEALNGASQKSVPVKKVFEATKSVSFDMTVKKVTIPLKWEKRSLNSSDESIELKSVGSTNGISHESECEEKDSVQSVANDFVDDCEQFGLSDSEVDKLLKDVDKNEKLEPSSTRPDIKQKNGVESSDSDTCSETVTTADDNMHGNCKKSSSVTDVALSCDALSENIQSSIPICNGDDSHNSEQLKNAEVSNEISDSKVFEVTDKGIDAAGENSARNAANPVGSEREITVLFQDSSAELKSNSETLVNPDKTLGCTGNCGPPHNELVKECKQYDTELFSDIESSNSLDAVEHENGKSSVVSSRTGDVPESRHCNQASEGSEADVHLFQELDGDFQGLDGGADDSEAVLNDKSVDLDLRSDGIEPSRIVCDVQLQQDVLMEPSGKLADVEMGSDEAELSKKSADVEMQNDENEVSSDLNDRAGSSDLDYHIAHVSEDREYDVNGPSMKPVDLEDKSTKAEHGDKLDDTEAKQSDKFYKSTEAEQGGKFYKGTEAEQGGKFDKGAEVEQDDKLDKDSEVEQIDKLDKDPEVEQDGKLCHVEKGYAEADVWQAVSNDKKIITVKAVDEGSVLRTKASSEHNGTASSEKETPFIELEHTVENGKAGKLVQKRTSESNSADDARGTKRARVECLQGASECDDESGDVFANVEDVETDNSLKVQTQEDEDKTFSENEDIISTMDTDSESQNDCEELDKECGERNLEGCEDKEVCSGAKEEINRNASKDSELASICSKRVHEPVGLIEVKKVRISPEVEKQLKLVECKNNSVEKAQNEGEEKQEPVKSVPLKEPKSNLDLAIERVATGISDEPEHTNLSDPARKLNRMPFMQGLHQNLLKKFSRNELEEFVVQKLCEVVTERCELGDVRQRCQFLEQMVYQWRKRAQQLQKQVRDMETVMKRYVGEARVGKERPVPFKVTRSVALQVQLAPVGSGMLRNHMLGSANLRSTGQVRRRVSRMAAVTVPAQRQPQAQQQQQPQVQQQQPQLQQQHQQQQQQNPVVQTTPTNAMTVQKVITSGFTKIASAPTMAVQSVAPRAPITTLVGPMPVSLKNIIARPAATTTTTAAVSTGSTTSTVSTINSTVINNNLRVAQTSQLSSRLQSKPTTVYSPNKSNVDLKVIDLTDEEDRAKSTAAAGIVRTVSATPAAITTNLISSSSVTTAVSATNNPGIQTGSIRVVQPHQLTGTTATTILAPSAPTAAAPRVAYFVPTSGGTVQQRPVLIASSASQVRPGVVSVANRQNQLPTLLFKNGTVVPIQQASGIAPVNTTAILRPSSSVQASQLQQVLNPTRTGQQIRVTPGLVTAVGRMTAPTITSVNPVLGNKHPAPLPSTPAYQTNPINWKFAPPKPELKISKVANKHQQGIVLSWNMQLTSEYEEIASYQLYAYQEGSAAPSTTLWKKVGDVKALPLPMACTLTQFLEGHKYHFAVRAVDVHSRVGPFSTPGNIVLACK